MVSLILVDSNNQILEFFNNPWWAIAVPISLIVGLWGLYATIRKKRKKIEHTILKTFDVGKGLNEEFPNLTLSYKQATITKYVWVLRGRLRMRDDIKIEKDNNEIELLLPEDCNVLEVKISSSHDKFTVGHYLRDRKKDEKSVKNTIVFKIKSSEWKEKEYFKYSCIFETPSTIESVEDSIKLEQRFHETKTVIIDRKSILRTAIKTEAWMFFAIAIIILLKGIFNNLSYTNEEIIVIIVLSILFIILYFFGTRNSRLFDIIDRLLFLRTI